MNTLKQADISIEHIKGFEVVLKIDNGDRMVYILHKGIIVLSGYGDKSDVNRFIYLAQGELNRMAA